VPNPSVGGEEFVVMRGAYPHAPATRVIDITRPRVNGHAFKELGKRGARVSLITERDSTNVGTLEATLRALIGTQVTVVVPESQSFSGVQVHDVTILNAKKVATPIGGIQAGSWYVTVQWDLQNVTV
jgi:hypothetical protein